MKRDFKLEAFYPFSPDRVWQALTNRQVLQPGIARSEIKTPKKQQSAPFMESKVTELKFLATPDKGEVSGLLINPPNARHLLVLGHGASTNCSTQ